MKKLVVILITLLAFNNSASAMVPRTPCSLKAVLVGALLFLSGPLLGIAADQVGQNNEMTTCPAHVYKSTQFHPYLRFNNDIDTTNVPAGNGTIYAFKLYGDTYYASSPGNCLPLLTLLETHGKNCQHCAEYMPQGLRNIEQSCLKNYNDKQCDRITLGRCITHFKKCPRRHEIHTADTDLLDAFEDLDE